MNLLLKWMIPFLFSALTRDIALGIVLLVLRRVSDKTKNTLDDEILELIERKIEEANNRP